MGSLILFALGIAAPIITALAVISYEGRRRSYFKSRLEHLAQENRGLRMSLGSQTGGLPSLGAANLAERKPGSNLGSQHLGAGQREAYQLRQALADWGTEPALAALNRLKTRLTSIAEMEMLWADPHAPADRDTRPMLQSGMWVFEPEFVVNERRIAFDQRFGAVAKPLTGTGLVPVRNAKDGEPTLVVELKGPRVTVGADQQLQAWNNVRELIHGGTIGESDPVDVYVVGGSIDQLDGNPRVEGRYRNVRITSYDYGQLIERAKRLTFSLYDEIKDTAPFLKQHRADIDAAQRAAQEEAAAKASLAAQARAGQTHDHAHQTDESEHVRYEEPADGPRRGEYEGPARPSRPRRHAAQ